MKIHAPPQPPQAPAQQAPPLRRLSIADLAELGARAMSARPAPIASQQPAAEPAARAEAPVPAPDARPVRPGSVLDIRV